ncbi:type II secretion system protein [Duganella sp. SAP-35]|uniref:Type II secretion system protein n=1 Tax=Duganella aceris TaxID=2703883 RepID=A0ABX0FJ25_9BURK|nr:type II secretion system protein [Duganella aceris]
MVVIVFGLVLMVVLQRVSFYGKQGDKAGVQALVNNMRSALKSREMSLQVRGDSDGIAKLEGSNPIGLLQRPPENYRGELGPSDGKAVEAGNWYFDVVQHQLIYVLVSNNVSCNDTDRICFKVESFRLFPKNASVKSAPADGAGVALNQVQN